MSNADDKDLELVVFDPDTVAEPDPVIAASKKEEYLEMPTISSYASAAINKADEAEAATAAKVNAVSRLTERIRRYGTPQKF